MNEFNRYISDRWKEQDEQLFREDFICYLEEAYLNEPLIHKIVDSVLHKYHNDWMNNRNLSPIRFLTEYHFAELSFRLLFYQLSDRRQLFSRLLEAELNRPRTIIVKSGMELLQNESDGV